MKQIIIFALLSAFLVLACTRQPQACTADAKLCPDGSAVGRDPTNNCEFYPCPGPIPVEPDGGIGLTNPYVQYVEYGREKCAATDWICIEGSSQFFNDTGCGCKADVPKRYISNDSEQCSLIRYMCEKNYVPFTDATGCGCEFTFDQPPQGFDCSDEQRNATCTKELRPVCGWSGPEIQCFKYPCASTYSNSCLACADENVAYYTDGECPG